MIYFQNTRHYVHSFNFWYTLKVGEFWDRSVAGYYNVPDVQTFYRSAS